MPRGYRCVLVAFVGWLSLAASPPKDATGNPANRSNEKVASAPNSIATALQQPEKPSKHDEPCDPGDNKRSSDLCAQWKAADAAKSAAQAAWWLGIVSSVIGAFTLAAAFAAARWAKKAAVETERTADAARDALAHQIETSNKQLRAYVSIGRPTVKKIKAETWIVTFPILNTGQTPATDVRGSLASSFEPYPVSRAAIQNLKMTERQVANIGPHAERYRYFQHDLDETLVELLNSGQMCFVYCVKISYTVFTGERIDDVCHWWIVRGPEMAHGAPSVLDDQHYCD